MLKMFCNKLAFKL